MALALVPVEASDDDLKLQVQLVWGTNDPKPDDDKLKEIDTTLAEKLGGAFKWKNYFTVEAKNFALSKKVEQKLKLSAKCEVVVRYKDESTLEIELIGEGQTFAKQQHPLQKIKDGQRWIIGGKDTQKWGDAWFVVLATPPAKK